MKYEIISTGSVGNAVVVENEILIDCGVSFKALKNVYKQLKLVLLTHIHSDHFNSKTLKRLSDERPTLRFGCCEWLVKPLVEAGISKRCIDVYGVGEKHGYKGFSVEPFKLCHDVENCGYKVHFVDLNKMLYATDTSTLDEVEAPDYDLYLIEANYTVEDLKRRIERKVTCGEFCYEMHVATRHLSQEQATEWLLKNMGAESEHCFLHQHREREK